MHTYPPDSSGFSLLRRPGEPFAPLRACHARRERTTVRFQEIGIHFYRRKQTPYYRTTSLTIVGNPRPAGFFSHPDIDGGDRLDLSFTATSDTAGLAPEGVVRWRSTRIAYHCTV